MSNVFKHTDDMGDLVMLGRLPAVSESDPPFAVGVYPKGIDTGWFVSLDVDALRNLRDVIDNLLG